MNRGDELIEQLLAGPDEDGTAANALLKEVFRGYPVEQLRRLLQSPVGVKAGAWIVSELGDRAGPLLDDVVVLLGHPERYVRFFAIDAVLVATTSAQGAAVARAIERIDDPDEAVRWKAMHLLARASAAQLTAAVPYLADERLRVLTAWLAQPSDMESRLRDADSLTRRFAAAASVRTRIRLESGDPEIAKFLSSVDPG